MADNVTGIVLDIPANVLNNIKNADKAIKDLEQTSKRAATNIKSDFATTMTGGVDAFIKKVQDAQTLLGKTKMPTIDATGLSSAIQELSKAMSTIDKSATTGSNRFGRIADAMTKLQTANPDPQLFQNIADGIAKIGNTSQQTIDNARNLSQIMAQLARDIRTVQSAQSAQSANTATAAQYNKLYKEQANILRDIINLQQKPTKTAEEVALLSQMKKRYNEIGSAISELNKKQQTAASRLAQQQGFLRREIERGITAPTGAIDYAKNAKSLTDLQAAYRNLKAVMATTKPDTKEWNQMNATLEKTRTHIDEIKRKMGEFKEQAKGVGDISGQLARTLAATFSVSAITGYMNKMIQVRAQFELQNTALRAILQNKDEADRIFMQVQQLAMQSPFTIMQMTNYTKQLAAYRIESEKLVGTTKMLADVSAGLGVDMGRLILAYGQVKAANYLRACLGKGTRVKLFDGTFKNVEDVVVGDVLMGDDEQPRHVSKLYQGEQQMYRVSYLGGAFRCNEHHILTVYDALKMRVSDVFVLDYLKEPYRYHGIKRIDGEYKTFIMKVEPDNIDTYYGFSIDGNHRFIIEDNIVTHNTEVRQFTEAGLNIAGELATYFSELQGKMISVGDVMDMITKRMVRFEDVEEVFKRVTSAGGLFYDMQKKQSETLWGQLQRIQDAMSIMFNEIGKSNQGMISTMLTIIRELINSWRDLVPYIKAAGAAFGAYFIVGKGLPAMVAYLKSVRLAWVAVASATNGAKGAMQAFNTAVKANPYGLIASAVALLVSYIWELVSAQSAVNEEMQRMQTESVSDMYQLIYRYRELADTVASVTTPYKDRKEALDELNRTYKDILPQEMLEIENIQKMQGAYDDVTEAIRTYSLEKLKQKQQELVNDAMVKSMENAKKEIMDVAGDFAKLNEKIKNVPESQIKGTINNIFTIIESEVLSGTLKIEDAQQEFINRFARFYDLDKVVVPKVTEYRNMYWDILTATSQSIITIFNQDTQAFTDAWDRVAKDFGGNNRALLPTGSFGFEKDVWGDLQKEMQGVTDEYGEMTARLGVYGSESERQMAESAQWQIDAFKEISKELTALKTAYDELYSLQTQGKLYTENGGITEMGMSAYNSLTKALAPLNEYLDKMGQTPFLISQFTDALTDNISQQEMFGKVATAVLGGVSKEMNDFAENTNNTYLKGFAKNVDTALSEVGGTKVQQRFASVTRELSKVYKVGMDAFNDIAVSAESSYIDIQKQADDMYKNLEDKFKKYKAALEEGQKSLVILNPEEHALNVSGLTKEQVDMAESLLAVFKALSKAFGGYEKSKNKGAQKDIWTPRLNLMQKVNKEYEKLLKYYSKEDAMAKIRSSYGDAVAEAFKGTQWADISKWGTFDAQATVDRLKKLAEVAGKDAKKNILEAAGTIEAEIEIKVKEAEIQKAKDDIQKAFDSYELTKTLGNLGLNVDLTYMVGGRPMTLPQIRKDLEDNLTVAKAKGGQEELVKTYEDYLRKVADMENKAAVERLKNYHKYFLKSASDRVRIELELQDEINKIRSSEELDTWSKNEAIKNARKETQKQLDELSLKEFRASDIYVNVFTDIENASRQSLEYVSKKLKELKSNLSELSVGESRQLVNDISKVDKQLTTLGGFKAWGETMRKAYEFTKKRKELEDELALTLVKADDLKPQVDAQELVVKNLQQQLDATDLLTDAGAELEKQVNDERKKYEEIKRIYDELIAKAKELGIIISDGNDDLDGVKKIWEDAVKIMNAASSAIGDIGEGLENMGLGSEGLKDGISSIQETLGSVAQAGTGVMTAIYDPDPIKKVTGALQALDGVAKLVGSISQIGDKKKERQIKRLQEKVEGLQKAYEKLGVAIEEAYSYDDYNMAYDQSMKNLEAQRQTIQEQMALEKAKKKTDKDRLKEYEDALEELAEREKQLRDERYDAMGSVSDKGVLSEAENFVSAWLDAYKETGDGLDALNEHWDGFFENLVMKQAASAVVSNRMAKYIKAINAAIDSGDTGLSLSQTFAQIGENLKAELGMWNEDLKAFFDAVGIKGGQGELLLSDLQKGIQNITEPQAAAIEAYLNSMRFAVFEQNNILAQMLTAIQAQYGSSTDNPILSEVKAIRSLVASIDDKLGRVIVNRNSGAGSYILKVG